MDSVGMALDEGLVTTRTVRRRLDVSRPVPPEIILECLQLATQAPTGGNRQSWRFVVVTDPDVRRALGELYARAFEVYRTEESNAARAFSDDPTRADQQERVFRSAEHLARIMPDVPAMLIPCGSFRVENKRTSRAQAGAWGSLLPAVWSFMLAARGRGLGTAWTTMHLIYEQEAAAILGIPAGQATQACLLPIAYTVGTDFRPARRQPLDEVVYWNQWGGA